MCRLTLPNCPALQRFDYIKFVSDAEQQETTKRLMSSHINQRYLETASPACGDVAMAFPFPQRHSLASPETEMQQIRREVMLGWPADTCTESGNEPGALSFRYAAG
ncbi:hypothetical protein E8R50_14790 [Escherichia coli]|nr:hypothetical protein E8R50_14790 [Escherichia coli]